MWDAGWVRRRTFGLAAIVSLVSPILYFIGLWVYHNWIDRD